MFQGQDQRGQSKEYLSTGAYARYRTPSPEPIYHHSHQQQPTMMFQAQGAPRLDKVPGQLKLSQVSERTNWTTGGDEDQDTPRWYSQIARNTNADAAEASTPRAHIISAPVQGKGIPICLHAETEEPKKQSAGENDEDPTEQEEAQDTNSESDEPEMVLVDGTAYPSLGSIGHPHSCGLACKYSAKARGCKDGVDCNRCHTCKFNRRGSNRVERAQRNATAAAEA